MADYITTANLIIRPDMCKRLDAAIYATIPTTNPAVINKAEVYRAEMVALIATYNTRLAEKQGNGCLYRLYTIIERLEYDHARQTNERGHANMQTAHNQLKNYK